MEEHVVEFASGPQRPEVVGHIDETPIALVEVDAGPPVVVGDPEIRETVAVEIPRRMPTRPVTHRVRHGDVQRSVAPVQIDGDVLIFPVRNGEIRGAVVVDIADRQ